MLDKILAVGKSNADYTARLSRFTQATAKEKFIRGIGVTVILAALLLQVFAALAPSKISAAPSPNDLIPGGVSSKQELVQDCKDNTKQIDKILKYYGIDCTDLAAGSVVSINSLDYNSRLYSVGHLAYGFASETPVNIGGETVYWRKLHAWDTHGSSTYKAVKFTNSKGKIFWSLFTCGNLVSVNVPKQVTTPTPPPPPPPPPPPTPGPPPKPPVCPYDSAILASSADCKPCTSSNSQYDALACLGYHKSVANLTRNITNANGSTASASDVLRYTLTVTNTGKLTAKDFVIQDNISDILEYAKLTNGGGGSLDADGFLSFPKVNIAPGTSITKTFSVTIMNPVPTTPPSADDPQAYNNVMTNVFGDTINVKVQQPASQQVVASASTSLPNTGPGTSMFVYAIIAAVAGYFYSSRRLQLKEARIALSLANQNQEP